MSPSDSDSHEKLLQIDENSGADKRAEPSKKAIEMLLAKPSEQTIAPGELLEALTETVNLVRHQYPEVWDQILKSASSFVQVPAAESKETTRPPGVPGELENVYQDLENSYQDLQNNLIQIRQATAQAIATEKQLEQQLQKNREQAGTWSNRAKVALHHGNDDLAAQATQREQQYLKAATELEGQLKVQKEATQDLRQRLTNVEGAVQKAYTKKQVLIARGKAATAHLRASELISAFNSDEMMAKIAVAQKYVIELEAAAAEKCVTELEPAAAAGVQGAHQIEIDPQRLLADTVAALKRATALISRMERKLARVDPSEQECADNPRSP